MGSRFAYFALTAFLGTVLAAALLVVGYDRLTVVNLTELGAEQNWAIASTLSNAAQDELRALLVPADAASGESSHAVVVDRLSGLLARESEGLPIYRVNVFDRNGTTVYSTDASRIGASAHANEAVQSALRGQSVSDLVKKHEWNAFDRRIEPLSLIQTYMPFRDRDGQVLGVFEVYSDVTPLIARMTRTETRIAVGAMIILGVLYVILVALYRRIDRRLRAEEEKTRSHLEQIERDNRTLEERVADRTRALDQARNFLQTAIDGMPDPAVVIGRDYHISAMNSAASRRLGSSAGEPRLCFEVLHGLKEPCERAGHGCTLVSGEPCRRIDIRVAAGDAPHQIQVTTTPLRGAGGALTGAIEILHDLDAEERTALSLRQAKDRAENESRVKSEMVATMSHEIRTPLNAVLGMTDLLRLTPLTRKQQGYLDVIQSSGSILLSLSENILDFNRTGRGALELRDSDFDLIELLERVVQVSGYRAYSKGLELALEMNAPRDLRIRADADRLRQVLVNLVSNAIKFSEQGEIVVAVDIARDETRREVLRFEVADEGIGMSDAVKQRLFEPFQLADEAAAGRQQGTGIGLAICKRIVDRMGGEIRCDSKIGAGTRIEFVVPLDRRPSRSDDVPGVPPSMAGQRVLVVADRPVMAYRICRYLEAWSVIGDVASSIADALNRLQAGASTDVPYAAAVIDASPRGLDALTLARRIRDTSAVSTLPLVLLRPISQPLEPGVVSEIGRVLCLNKPVLPSELRTALVKSFDGTRTAPPEHAPAQPRDRDSIDLRILVAEDNEVNRRVLLGMLNSLGYTADFVVDGPSVLTQLDRANYDIVLMDCQMPGLDGEEVTRRIRGDRTRFTRQPVVVAVTADASVEHRNACLAAGMDDFIAKPLRLAELKSGLARWRAVAQDARGGSSEARYQVDLPTESSGTAMPPLESDQQMLAHLRERTAGQGRDVLGGYIDLFLADAEQRLRALGAASAKGDTTRLKRECHALKGACLEMGAVRMRQLCDALPAHTDGDDRDGVSRRLAALEAELARLRPVLGAARSAELRGRSRA